MPHGKNRKKGFTLVELVVVMAILGILLALAVPNFMAWRKQSEFEKDENYARTLFLSAQSALSSYDAAGTLGELMNEVKAGGRMVSGLTDSDGSTIADNKIYGVCLDAGASYEENSLQGRVKTLLELYTYDAAVLQGAVVVEFDVDAGTVYSVFVSTWNHALVYGSADATGQASIDDRSYEARRQAVIGYYSARDVGNVVRSGATRLKMTNLVLRNEERLELVWSSNVVNTALQYDLTFYSEDGTKLFSLSVPLGNGLNGETAGEQLVNLPVTLSTPDGTATNYTFPVQASGGTFTLTLDAMMSAQTLENMTNGLKDASGFSITRLGVDGTQRIYVTASVQADAEKLEDAGLDPDTEYTDSSTVTSNTEHPLFAYNTTAGDDTGTAWKVGVAYFRHLYNIRWLEALDTAAHEYTQQASGSTLPWKSDETVVYDSASASASGWVKTTGSGGAAFPTVPQLGENSVYNGGGQRISGLLLNDTSVAQTINEAAPLRDATGTDADARCYLGLFGVVQGKVNDLTFANATLQYGTVSTGEDAGTETEPTAPVTESRPLYGAGVLCGLCTGQIGEPEHPVALTSTLAQPSAVTAAVTMQTGCYGGVGGLVGAAATKDYNPASLQNLSVQGTVAGRVEAALQKADGEPEGTTPAGAALADPATAAPQSGIGGVVGNVYAAALRELTNEADVTGNLLVGGVVGSVCPSGENTPYTTLTSLTNTGLVQGSAAATGVTETENENGVVTRTIDPQATAFEGWYIGGVAGYVHGATMTSCTSTAGAGFAYDPAQKDALLRGRYVGGIVGYCHDTNIDATCTTGAGGYILGDSEVGGIAGGVGVSEGGSATVSTTNASYVIGNRNVGGIVGSNSAEAVVTGCTNSGLVVANQWNAGGVVGSNVGTITNCTSTVYSYGNSLLTTMQSWNAYGDNVGGIAGYNNGIIKTEGTDTLNFAPMVVGRLCVGGLVGFNGPDAIVNVDYVTEGRFTEGRVIAQSGVARTEEELADKPDEQTPKDAEDKVIGQSGDFAGGLVGYNLSAQLFQSEQPVEVTLSEVTGHDYVGGAVGYSRTTGGEAEDDNKDDIDLKLYTLSTLGQVTGNRYVGGLIGWIQHTDGKVTLGEESGDPKTYNVMNVAGWQFTGGLIGYASDQTKLTIQNAVNEGDVTAPATAEPEGLDYHDLLASDLYDKNDEEQLENLTLHCVGGIIGYNNQDGTLDRCEVRARVSGRGVLGGLVGLNAGTVQDCTLTQSIGSTDSDGVGGVAGINAGTVKDCTIEEEVTVTAGDYAGGVAALSLCEGQLLNDRVAGQVTALGDYVGGVAGYNNGTVSLYESGVTVGGSVRGDDYVGGVIGYAASGSDLRINEKYDATAENITVSGGEYVGGIFGRYAGEMSASEEHPLVNRAAVTAQDGMAGGIAGRADGDLNHAQNYAAVTAQNGDAAGVTAQNSHTIKNCQNYASVSAQNGSCGGVTCINDGTIESCAQYADGAAVQLRSGADSLGGIAAENNGSITGCTVSTNDSGTLELLGSAKARGGIVGRNNAGAALRSSQVTGAVTLITEGVSADYVGGVAGQNAGTINGADGEANSTVSMSMTFDNVRYLGGVAGENTGTLCNYTYSGALSDTGSGGAGRCVGGVVGNNGDGAALENCSINGATLTLATGVCPSDTTATHAVKDSASSHLGGIAGRNGAGATVTRCTLTGTNTLTVSNGGALMGGVTGYNQGTVTRSGSELAKDDIITKDLDDLDLQSATEYMAHGLDEGVTSLSLKGGSTTAAEGGLVGLNGPAGVVQYSASGLWQVNNGSSNADSTAGGIIGMNEAEGLLTNLLNFASVTRSNSWVAGGIIGRQENRTTQDYTIANCLNFGEIRAKQSRSAGVIGSWKYMGGTLNGCRNYGVIGVYNVKNPSETHFTSGIVSILMYMNTDQTVTMVNCRNSSPSKLCTGILNRINNLSSNTKLTVELVDCINTADTVTAGIFGSPDEININSNYVNISLLRCRNYGTADSGHGVAKQSRATLSLQDCFDISESTNSLSGTTNTKDVARNYYIDADSFQFSFTGSGEAPEPQVELYLTTGMYAKVDGSDTHYGYYDPLAIDSNTVGFQKGDQQSDNDNGMDQLFTAATGNHRMSFVTNPSKFVPVEFVIPFSCTASSVEKVTTQWFGNQDRTYTFEIWTQGTDGTWTIVPGSDTTVQKAQATNSGTSAATITTTVNVANVKAIKLRVTDEKRDGQNSIVNARWVSLWNMSIYAEGDEYTPLSVGASAPSTPPTTGTEPTAKAKGERLYLATFAQGQYFCRLTGNYTAGALHEMEQDKLALNTNEETGDKTVVLVETGAAVATCILNAADAGLAGSFSETSTVTNPADWTDWEKMLAVWYDSLYSVTAPTDLKIEQGGQTYQLSWTDTNNGQALYYQTQIFVFDTKEAAEAALADEKEALDSITPAVTLYTYTGSEANFTLQSGWEGKYFVARTCAAGPSQNSGWAYTDPQVTRFVVALPSPTVRGELKLNAGSDDAKASSYNYYYRVVDQDELDSLIAAAIEQGVADGQLTGLTDLAKTPALYWGVDATMNNSNTKRIYKDAPVTLSTNSGNLSFEVQSSLNTAEQVAARVKTNTGCTDADLTAAEAVRAYLSALYGNSAAYTTMAMPTAGDQLDTQFGLSGVEDVTLSGDTDSSFAVSARVKRSSSGSDGAAIYVVELVCERNDKEALAEGEPAVSILAQTEVTIARNGSTAVSFEGIDPAALQTEQYTLYLRARLAQSPLGPLYYYYPADESGNLTIQSQTLATLDNLEYYNTVLLQADGLTHNPAFADLVRETELTGYELIPAPTLQTPTAKLADESLQYTFSWTPSAQDANSANRKYDVTVYGVTLQTQTDPDTGEETTAEVLTELYTGTTEAGVTTLTLPADDWTDETIRLQVTPVGEKSGGTLYLGQTATGEWPAQKRLTAPGQPIATLTDANEMLYDISFLASVGEDGNYGTYDVRLTCPDPEDETKTLTVSLGKVNASGSSSYKLEKVDMSAYEGQSCTLYVVALPAESSTYFASPSSVRTGWQLPTRLAQPQVNKWEAQWKAENAYLPAAFESTALEQHVTLSNAQSVNTYITRAEVYDPDDVTTADDGTVTLKDGAEPVCTTGTVSMQRISILGGDTYSVTYQDVAAQYAGYYLRPMIRATRGTAISSQWVYAEELEQLPGLKLDTPTLTLSNRQTALTGEYSLLGDFEGTDVYPLAITGNLYTVNWTQENGALATGYRVKLNWLASAVGEGQQAVDTLLLTAQTDETGTVTGWKAQWEDPTAAEGTEIVYIDLVATAEGTTTTYALPADASETVVAALTRTLTGKSRLPGVETLDNEAPYRIPVVPQLSIEQAEDGWHFTVTLPDPAVTLFSDETSLQSLMAAAQVTALAGEQTYISDSDDVQLVLHQSTAESASASLVSETATKTTRTATPEQAAAQAATPEQAAKKGAAS